MITIKDVPTVTGKLTVYHDITLEDIECPFCSHNLNFERRIKDQRGQLILFIFSCPLCNFEFKGVNDTVSRSSRFSARLYAKKIFLKAPSPHKEILYGKPVPG